MEEQAKLLMELAKTMIPDCAKIYRLMYENLIKEGFTKEEAFEITKSYNFKS